MQLSSEIQTGEGDPLMTGTPSVSAWDTSESHGQCSMVPLNASAQEIQGGRHERNSV